MSLNVIGLDAGFSATKRSSGVAWLRQERLKVGCANASWEDRWRLLDGAELVQVVAIDAPILPSLSDRSRLCERVFSRGSFQRRCKPGLSHVPGTGQNLRKAGQSSTEQFSSITAGSDLVSPFPRVVAGVNVVEAFPNAYLGVMLPGRCFDNVPLIKRGKKFDWLYDLCLIEKRLLNVMDEIGVKRVDSLREMVEVNRNHDERAALVCLLVAVGVTTGRYTAVGDESGGYFFLPPWETWSEWAQRELECQRQVGLDIWINGLQYAHSDPLPMIS